ncbi:NHLP family bacteriocin export ABC transporter peptidase/permease/ATPase subunit [Oribacterium sp. FC2011]|uniref:NHLP family bacteriocin export ABC transporter peptidase/permease/ATPase subunit n=1 Tax=Oribacterium sp. FC2011 TaxID=1408311 RepID=UPI0005D19D31|nr:NHLP family bacteriocin export ABC transporter peptidase/permease/ATPase subunit [Oribacterium sp. FC2011]
MHDKKVTDKKIKHRSDVPVIMQLETPECGAAALAMVMAYYNKWIPLEKVRVDCGVSRNGSNAKNLLAAARHYGFSADGFRCEIENLKEDITLPCILHWNLNHFVVLKGFRGDYALINDPAKGDIRISMEELDSSFTGVCLEITPGPEMKPSGEPPSIYSFVRSRLKGTQIALIFVIMSTTIGSLFGIINPAFTRFFVDRLLTGENRELLYPFIGILALTGIAGVVVSFIQSVYSLRLNGKMAAIGKSEYMWNLLKLPIHFFSQRLAGDLQQRQNTNAAIAATLVNTLTPLIMHTFMMILYLVLMLRWSVVLTLIGVTGILINLIVSRIITGKLVNIARVKVRDQGKLAASTISGIHMIETIKASGSETGFFQKWAGLQASVNAQTVRFIRMNRFGMLISTILSASANALVLILGVLLTMQGRFTLGTILLFQGFLASFMSPAREIISTANGLQEMRTDMERVEDVMQYPEDPVFSMMPDSTSSKSSKLTGDVELRNIVFGYSPLEDPLIKDFSMHVKKGGSVALVGASGSGKSTLSKLISGLYRPWSGEILFDGNEASYINRNVFTGSVAVVDQDIVLFDDTIADNIKMWDNSIEDFEMILAARDAQIYDDIMAREGGFYRKMAENGRDFSGGQRQRLEIARALAQDPSIMIMDEATSALDAKTEAELVKAIKDRGITLIIIAHRLSTIRDCDEIIVLEDGRVAERGTHEQLMSMEGAYSRLIKNG